MSLEHIRNFSIVAHIDHGKSTLADRVLDVCKAVEGTEEEGAIARQHGSRAREGHYDQGPGRSLKLSCEGWEYLPVQSDRHTRARRFYLRSFALFQSCDGAILVVDATQGVEAQTLANVYLAIDNDLEIVPAINKVDLPSADVERAKEEIENFIGLDTSAAVPTSGKTGVGVEDLLEAVVSYLPPPEGDPEAPLQALLFDSWFDSYRGVICLVRVKHGRIVPGQKDKAVAVRANIRSSGGWSLRTPATCLDALETGEVGFVIAGIKDIHQTQVGDTMTDAREPCAEPLSGFKEVQPMVFSGVFPVDSKDYQDLKDALEKLKLNDASFQFEPETSAALGFGFRWWVPWNAPHGDYTRASRA